MRIRNRSKRTAMAFFLVLTLIVTSYFSSAAVVSHSPAQVTPGTFAAGNYIFPDNLSVTGSVGIGTASPLYLLDVNGTGRLTGALTSATINTGSGAMKLGDAAITDGDTNNIPTNDQVYDFVIGQNYLTSETGDISGVAAGNGLTGGGTSGSVTLNIGAGTGISVAADSISINEGTSGSWFSKGVYVGGDGVMEVGRYIDFHDANADTSDFDFRLSNTGSTLEGSGIIGASDYIYALGGLHVGGTSDPGTDNLLIDGTLGVGTSPTIGDKFVVYTADGSGDVSMLIGNDQANKFLRLGYSDALDFASIQGGVWGGTTRSLALQGGGGYVGIGIYTPSYPLHIKGNWGFLGLDTTSANQDSGIRLVEGGSNRWTIYNDGAFGDNLKLTDAGGDHGVYLAQDSNTWSQISDERLKTNITPLTDTLDNLNSIRGVRYILKNNSRYEIGLIAQELNSSYPELITKFDDKYYGIMYDGIGPILVEAVKELRTEKNLQIEQLKQEKDSEITDLKQENQNLKIKNQQLENALCSINQGFEFCN